MIAALLAAIGIKRRPPPQTASISDLTQQLREFARQNPHCQPGGLEFGDFERECHERRADGGSL